MNFESITLSRAGSAAHQVTIWSDGVARWDGERGLRAGAWQSMADADWLKALGGLLAGLPPPLAMGEAPDRLVIETVKKRRTYPLARRASPAAVWRIGMVLDGICVHLPWSPLDVTGHCDLSAWAGGRWMMFRQGVAYGSGLVQPDGLLLLAGSVASPATAPTLEENYHEIRAGLIEDGGLELSGDTLRLTRHVLFTSPSAPACVLAGSNTNGRRAWRDEDGASWADLGLDEQR